MGIEHSISEDDFDCIATSDTYADGFGAESDIPSKGADIDALDAVVAKGHALLARGDVTEAEFWRVYNEGLAFCDGDGDLMEWWLNHAKPEWLQGS